jgi:hypothetical protein
MKEIHCNWDYFSESGIHVHNLPDKNYIQG